MKLYRDSDGMASVMIQAPMLMEWGITSEELWETAMKNLKKEQHTIKGMGEILKEVLGVGEDGMDDACPMYILGNPELCHGAAGILREDLMKEFAEKIKRNFYILPSSIHELILVPDNKEICAEELRKMVTEINET